MRKTPPLLLLAILLITSCRISDDQRTAVLHSVTAAILNAVAGDAPTLPETIHRAAFHEESATSSAAPPHCALPRLASASCPTNEPKPSFIPSTDLQLPRPTNVVVDIAVLRPACETTARQRVCSLASDAQKRWRRALLVRMVEVQNTKCVSVSTVEEPAVASTDEGEDDRVTRS